MKTEAMLTTPQAAERLGVSTARIRQLILEGRLTSQQFGRDHLIAESDLAPLLVRPKAGRPKKEGALAVVVEKLTAKKGGRK